MLFIFSIPELIRNLWQLKTAVFLHWCLILALPLYEKNYIKATLLQKCHFMDYLKENSYKK